MYVLALITFSGRSLMKMMNRSGPKIEPCGTPDVIGSELDNTPLMLTFCRRPFRNFDFLAFLIRILPFFVVVIFTFFRSFLSLFNIVFDQF